MPVILAIQEAKIRRIEVQSQPWEIVRKTLFEKTHHTHTKRAGGVAQGVGPEFKGVGPEFKHHTTKKNPTQKSQLKPFYIRGGHLYPRQGSLSLSALPVSYIHTSKLFSSLSDRTQILSL
jgi:hypothetical protein